MKLIDADKLIEWVDRRYYSFDTKFSLYETIRQHIEAGTFSPTPPVQPDIKPGDIVKLEVGAIYLCSDGDIRKLNLIEDDFLHYSVPVGDKEKWRWMSLGRTYRWQAEPLFLGGKIIDQSEVDSG